LIRSSSPQSEATNTALIESPSEKKHSKNQAHRRPKKGRETQKLKPAIRMKWVDGSTTHHHDRAVDRIPSDATAETPMMMLLLLLLLLEEHEEHPGSKRKTEP